MKPWLHVADDGSLAVDLRAFYASPEGAAALRAGAIEYGLNPDHPETAEKLAELVERMLEEGP